MKNLSGIAILRKLTGVVAIVFITSLGGAGDAHPTEQAENEFVEAVHDYVRQTRNWPEGSFRIIPQDSRDGMHIFSVIYLADETALQIGGSESFEAHIAPGSGRVEKELRYQ